MYMHFAYTIIQALNMRPEPVVGESVVCVATARTTFGKKEAET